MAFNQKIWKDRDVQYPGKRTLTSITDNSDIQDVIVERAEGTITEIGDLFCAETMNNLEQRIADAFNSIFIYIDEEIDHMYPVGAIYQSFDRTSPEQLFPGTTWVSLFDEELRVGRVPVAVPTNEQGGQNRGNTSYKIQHTPNGQVTLTGSLAGALADMPAHQHSTTDYIAGYQNYDNKGGAGTRGPYTGIGIQSRWDTTGNAGGNQLHTHTCSFNVSQSMKSIEIDIRQQYITMYAWRRTA